MNNNKDLPPNNKKQPLLNKIISPLISLFKVQKNIDTEKTSSESFLEDIDVKKADLDIIYKDFVQKSPAFGIWHDKSLKDFEDFIDKLPFSFGPEKPIYKLLIDIRNNPARYTDLTENLNLIHYNTQKPLPYDGNHRIFYQILCGEWKLILEKVYLDNKPIKDNLIIKSQFEKAVRSLEL